MQHKYFLSGEAHSSILPLKLSLLLNNPYVGRLNSLTEPNYPLGQKSQIGPDPKYQM